MIIAGAGLSGLIAAHAFPNATIIERSEAPAEGHRALLRFRTHEVGDLVGVPFRKVRVYKAIWYEGSYVQPDPRMANLYSRKCLGAPLARSIWDLAPADRFVAPDDLYERLIKFAGRRIRWGTDLLSEEFAGPILSTIPLPTIAILLSPEDLPSDAPTFNYAPIRVDRFRISGADVHQTVYFPQESTPTYRASITGDTLIVESMDNGDPRVLLPYQLAPIFGLAPESLFRLEQTRQSYGKIAPIPDPLRRELIYRLTTRFNVYSVGRFATWRNILLDDVIQDLRKVKGMIEQQDNYSRHAAANR